MGRATQFFILHILILAFKNLLCCAGAGPLFREDHGHGFYQERAKATKSPSSTYLVPPPERLSCSFSAPALQALHQAQQAPLARSTAAALNPCSLLQNYGFKTTILALQYLPCGHEGHVPALLEMWARMGILQRWGFHSTGASPTAALQPTSRSTASLEQSAVAGLQLWLLESTDTHSEAQQRTQAEQRQWDNGREEIRHNTQKDMAKDRSSWLRHRWQCHPSCRSKP